jgi:polysaccharide biosynthesis transport protein
LLKYDSDQLMVYAPALNLPDNIIRNLYPQYLEAKRQLDGLKISGWVTSTRPVLIAVDQSSR